MGVYQLRCSESDAAVIWDRWVGTNPTCLQEAWATPRFEVWGGLTTDGWVTCALRWTSTRRAQWGLGFWLIVFVVASEFFWRHLFSIEVFLAPHPTILWITAVPLMVIAMVLWLFPFLFLAHFLNYRADEQRLVDCARAANIACRTLAAQTPSVFFTGDALVLQVLFTVALLAQGFSWLGVSGFAWLALLALVLAAISLPALVLETYFEAGFYTTKDPYDLWRLNVARRGSVTTVFVVPILLYFICWGLLNAQYGLLIGEDNIRHIPLAEGLRDVLRGSLTEDHRDALRSGVLSPEWPLFAPYHIAAILVVVLVVLTTLPVVAARVSPSRWKATSQLLSQSLPNDSSFPTVPRSSGVSWLTWAYWVNNLLVGLIGAGIVVAAMIWVVAPSRGSVFTDWLAPFAWWELALGNGWVARGLVILFCLPALTWLSLLVLSNASPMARLIGANVRPARQQRVRARLDLLCDQLALPRPALALDHTTASWPEAIVVLPFMRCCLLQVSTALAEELSDAQLDLVLAHELGHLVQHRRQLWFVQFLSRIGFAPPGFLTLSLDYRTMEFEADAFVATVTGQANELANLLHRDLARIEYLAGLRLDERGESPQPRGPHGWARDVYAFYSSEVWGAIHPSGPERAALLRRAHPEISER